MSCKIYKTRISGASDGSTENPISGYRLANTWSRAVLAGLLEALQSNPKSCLFIDVWKNNPEDQTPYSITASVVGPKKDSSLE